MVTITTVLGKLDRGQLGPGILGPGQLGPGQSTFLGQTQGQMEPGAQLSGGGQICQEPLVATQWVGG